jgi:hypothetical protein
VKIVHGTRWTRTSFTLIVLVWLTGTVITFAADSAKSPDDAYLDALQGRWIMDGTLGGKSVRYFVDGQRVLQGKFVKLHIADAGPPPQYEADVYIGFDAKAKDYIAHWLDRFGAPGARVVARGERQGQRLVLIFPYAEGAFRDTFTWQPESRSWSALLESQNSNDTWSTFASYTLSRSAQ